MRRNYGAMGMVSALSPETNDLPSHAWLDNQCDR